MSAEAQQILHFDWLHDDTEEDLVGAEWHQNAIVVLSTSLEMLAMERGQPWHVGNQLTLIGSKPDGTDWSPIPDVCVHPTLGPHKRENLDVRVEGAPVLVIEVASPSTWQYDVSVESTRHRRRQAGKAYGYLVFLQVLEYLVFDPNAEFLAGQVRAWRRAGDLIQEWMPEADGRYHCQSLNIGLRPDGPFLRVFDPAGNAVPYWFEATRENAALRQANQEHVQRIAALEAELERLRPGRDQEN